VDEVVAVEGIARPGIHPVEALTHALEQKPQLKLLALSDAMQGCASLGASEIWGTHRNARAAVSRRSTRRSTPLVIWPARTLAIATPDRSILALGRDGPRK
jgi:hypothetical protein